MAGQQRLLHDVSHELRSPLARLHAAIGLARQRPENAAASLDRIEFEADRMNDLVGELLTLSRIEAGVAITGQSNIDLMDLVAGIVEDARFEGQQEGQDVVLTVAAPALVRGRVELIHRAIENVVRNAMRHTPPGETVEVRIESHGGRVRVTVLDRGPGVSTSMLTDMFKPFVRAAHSPCGEGYGLGLAIAQRVVETLDGSIEASHREGGGLSVAMEFPLAQDKIIQVT